MYQASVIPHATQATEATSTTSLPKDNAAHTTTKRAREATESSGASASTHEKAKKKARVAALKKVSEFSLSSDAVVGSLTKLKMCSIIPLQTPAAKPVYVQLSGGGNIPVSFGLGESSDNPHKWTLNMNVTNKEEEAHLARLTNELIDVAQTKWSSWFPSGKTPSREAMRESFCNGIVKQGQAKKDGAGTWPGITKASFETSDCENNKCTIVTQDGDRVNFRDLPGMGWHKAVFELKQVYILGNKSFGISKRLRYLQVSENEKDELIVPL